MSANCLFKERLYIILLGVQISLEARVTQFRDLGVEAEALLATPQIKGESNSVAEYTTDFFERLFVV